MLSGPTAHSVRLALLLMASSALLPSGELKQSPTDQATLRYRPRAPSGLRTPKLTGGGISSYRLGSDHLSLRVPVNCTPAPPESAANVYNLRAPFHILYVQVTFVMLAGTDGGFDCRISHGDVNLKNRVANFSLGLGPNSLTFLTQSVALGPLRESARRVQLHIRRLERPQLRSVKSHSHATELRVCQLIQDCDFIHSGGYSCGLEAATATSHPADSADGLSWPRWLQKRRDSLPECSLGQLASGARWHIPCVSCDAPETCAWRLARWWHPDCLSEYPALKTMRQRLEGVRVVFLGDSTLRGLMFSLYQMANGSLHRWVKSHDTLLLTGRNGRSRMDFSYYPQFWLPANRTLGFRESLRRILLISQNDTAEAPERASATGSGFNKTVIVIGGAQWLSGAELKQTREVLTSLGLSAPVIVKDLSPGFHIRVPGVTFKPLTRFITQELANRNSELHALATSLGFSVLPTFRLTAARYREFHPGKCACHFHTVVPRRRSGKQGLDGYEVDGDIHRTCFELLTALLDSVL